MLIKPGRAFWSGFTAFTANMVALVSVDKLAIATPDIQIDNWWIATLASLFVGLAVYGKEKLDELREPKEAA